MAQHSPGEGIVKEIGSRQARNERGSRQGLGAHRVSNLLATEAQGPESDP